MKSQIVCGLIGLRALTVLLRIQISLGLVKLDTLQRSSKSLSSLDSSGCISSLTYRVQNPLRLHDVRYRWWPYRVKNNYCPYRVYYFIGLCQVRYPFWRHQVGYTSWLYQLFLFTWPRGVRNSPTFVKFDNLPGLIKLDNIIELIKYKHSLPFLNSWFNHISYPSWPYQVK